MKKSPLDLALEEVLLAHKNNLLAYKYRINEKQCLYQKVVLPNCFESLSTGCNEPNVNLANSEQVHGEGLVCTGDECKFNRKIRKSVTISPMKE